MKIELRITSTTNDKRLATYFSLLLTPYSLLLTTLKKGVTKMVDKLWKKAKAIIGLDEEENVDDNTVKKDEGLSLDLGPLKFKTSKKSSDAELEIVIYEPRAYEDSLSISAKLRQGSPVIINLKYLDSTEGMRLIDFVCGTAFAIDGHMTKIADTIFLLAPSNVSLLDNSQTSQSESGGLRDGLLHSRM